MTRFILISSVVLSLAISLSYCYETTLKKPHNHVNSNVTHNKDLSNNLSTVIHPPVFSSEITTPNFKNVENELYEILNYSNNNKIKPALHTLFTFWIKENSKAVFRILLILSQSKNAELAYISLFEVWAQHDINSFDLWIKEQPSKPIYDKAILSALLLDDIDVEYKIEWAVKVHHLPSRTIAIKKILTDWTKSDSKTALTWSLENEHNQQYIRHIFFATGKHNPIEAIQLFEQLPRNDEEVIYEAALGIEEVIGSLPLITSDILLSIEAIPLPTLRKIIYQLTLPKLIKHDSLLLAQIINRIPEEPTREALQQELIRSWATLSPQMASTYINSLPSGNNKSLMALELIDNWQQNNSEEIHEWLSSIDDQAVIDTAAAKFAENTSVDNSSIHYSTQWLEQIQNATIKKETVMNVVASWYQFNSLAALQYLQTTESLTAAEKEQFFRELEANNLSL